MASSNCSNSCDWDCDFENNLNLHKLCAKKIKAHSAHFKDLSVENFDFGTDLCIPGQLTSANLLNCSKYVATSVYSTITTYNLGDYLNFDTIIDDPNGNMAVAPTAYTVPVSGYYLVTMQIDQQNLQPDAAFGPILGTPVANPQLYVNGVLTRQLYSAYLSFFNQQRVTLTSISKFNAGDVIQGKLQILSLNQNSGVATVTGTVDIIGNASLSNDSVFIIHMLSATCGPNPCGPTGTGCMM
jgi:hypothetical protein